KVEASKVETSKVEASKVEASKVETSKVEASKVETSKVEASKVETSKVEASKVEASRVETSKSPDGGPLSVPVSLIPKAHLPEEGSFSNQGTLTLSGLRSTLPQGKAQA
ncbi:hypothetical protein P7K49_014690, partial [Saguinus oedipus]